VTGVAVVKAASAGATRRLTQTVVVFVVLAMATTAALVGLALATYPARAFQALSARYHTADLAVTIDATKATSAQLARTRRRWPPRDHGQRRHPGDAGIPRGRPGLRPADRGGPGTAIGPA